jgi:murein DD-endopeptidase MepM/ murein hydrolase activator NlpD
MAKVNIILRFFIACILVLPGALFAASIEVEPEQLIQGEPLYIKILGTDQKPQSISFDGKNLGIFSYKNIWGSLYGIDLYKKSGAYKVSAKLSDGTILEKEVTIGERKKETAPLGIPQKLGGNTPQAATKLVNTLAQENASLLGLRTGTHAFWSLPWRHPVANPIVTDTYGYQRQTGGYSIAHKGTDFRADEGTKVMAMNRGVVRLVQNGRNYGKTIVVDHGLGLQTFYMHLSKIYVNPGELVLPGQIIGLSGMTGYAEKPHLHLTVRLNETSIDPELFLKLFN